MAGVAVGIRFWNTSKAMREIARARKLKGRDGAWARERWRCVQDRASCEYPSSECMRCQALGWGVRAWIQSRLLERLGAIPRGAD